MGDRVGATVRLKDTLWLQPREGAPGRTAQPGETAVVYREERIMRRITVLWLRFQDGLETSATENQVEVANLA